MRRNRRNPSHGEAVLHGSISDLLAKMNQKCSSSKTFRRFLIGAAASAGCRSARPLLTASLTPVSGNDGDNTATTRDAASDRKGGL